VAISRLHGDGWQVAKVYKDHGISGAKGRNGSCRGISAIDEILGAGRVPIKFHYVDQCEWKSVTVIRTCKLTTYSPSPSRRHTGIMAVSCRTS
jgi:hypothetical protein